MNLPVNKVCQDFAQGDAFLIKVSHNPIPSKGPAGAIGIEGAIFELTLKKKESGLSVLSVSYTVPAGADATAGIAYIPIAAVDSYDVAPGVYFGSLKRAYLGEQTKTLIRSGMNSTKKVEIFKNLKNI